MFQSFGHMNGHLVFMFYAELSVDLSCRFLSFSKLDTSKIAHGSAKRVILFWPQESSLLEASHQIAIKLIDSKGANKKQLWKTQNKIHTHG